MAIFVLSDLHLSTDDKTNKSMEVFGNRWQDYISKIEKNWNAVVSSGDTVIVPGDISWAMKLEDSYADLKFLDSLNGKKLLGKGNHDFWWATVSKMKKFFEQSGFQTLDILYNNAHVLEDRIVCGTRGWFPDESKQITVGEVDFDKIVNREVGRLTLSLNDANSKQRQHVQEHGEQLPIQVFLHFPPVWAGMEMTALIDVLKEYNIEQVFFGHIHSSYAYPASFVHKGIKFTLTSSDFLSFYPLKI
ncbi:MAG: serine/threonine protein phosphatase [Ruminococcaceae bacterium]|nr:serine/threonine protein phosphatase [Oscillospiraceae bacterium]